MKNSLGSIFTGPWFKKPQEHVADFITGFTELSAAAFASMIAATVLSVAATFWFFSATTLAGHLGQYAARSPLDAEGFVTVEALRLAKLPQERPRLIILGTSSVGQAMGDPAKLIEQFENHPCTSEWDVHMLVTPLQTKLDQLTLIETVMRNRKIDDPELVFALGVGIHRIGSNNERLIGLEQSGRLGIRSDWADEGIRALGVEPRRRSSIYLLENYQFVVNNFLAAFLRALLQSPAERMVDSYSEGLIIPAYKRPRENAKSQYGVAFDQPNGLLRHLETVQNRLIQYPNVHLVLIDELLSPDFLYEADLIEQSDQVYDTFSQTGSVFIAMMKEAGLSSEDYHDDYHIRKGAPQDLVRSVFAKKFATFCTEINTSVQ